ncbi:MAG: autophagy protein 13 [Phylliscum demangeonii]|nr:MAG: autophagy protein 13 [Phylliscum demangeonii]
MYHPHPNVLRANYFVKAALILAQSRMICPPSYNKESGLKRVNKWFNVEIDETDIFREDWRLWKTCDAERNRPPPMVLETYLDTATLTNSQSLVLVDDQGKRWNVDHALNSSPSSSTARPVAHRRRTQIILERWTVQLGDAPPEQPSDLNSVLPVIYKKSIVLFRSLFTYSKFLPAWKFAKQVTKLRLHHSALRVHCRILNPDASSKPVQADLLRLPLSDGRVRVTEDFSFGSTESPAGPFSVAVTYRTNCEFRIDDSEALLSSQFMGSDEHLFRPSLGNPAAQGLAGRAHGAEVGSLPPERRGMFESPDRSQAYGSLSTFHQVGPATGTSPISALRAAKELGREPSPSSPPIRAPPHPRSSQSSKTSQRLVDSAAEVARRPSVSFMPFKTPSLSASPSYGGAFAPSSPRGVAGRTPLVSALTQARNIITPEPQSSSSLRGVSVPPDNLVSSRPPSSPRPASVSRYSSSFGHRRGRLSSGGASKTDDDTHSSGRASQTSSHAQPGSGVLAEGGAGGSSGSIQTDDDNISDFLKMLDSKKNLRSFESPGSTAAVDASSRRTSAALSKFQRLRESHAALSDSLSSSLVLQRSSSASSRQLSSIPPMVAGTSLSPSSSPGKPISPHTPHTPAVPSRLSAHSVAVYASPHRSSSSSGTRTRTSRESRESGRFEARAGDEGPGPRTGSHAIDIPSSPRPILAHDRRSSSVAQRHRAMAIEDETGDLLPYGMRSASLGAHERPPLSLSALLGLHDASEVASSPREGADRVRVRAGDGGDQQSEPMSRRSSSSSLSQAPNASRDIYDGALRSAYGPPRGSGGGSGGGGRGTVDRPRSGRDSYSRLGAYDEDEPLLFAMSEIGGPSSRRSLEEAHGAAGAGLHPPAALDHHVGGGDAASDPRRGHRGGHLGGGHRGAWDP